MDKMKVCLLNDSYPPVIDGVANVVLNYSRIMQTEGLADVMVATPRYPDADYSVYPYKVVPYQSFDTTKIVKGYRAGNPFDLKEIKEMSDFKPDIIHTHCPVASAYIARSLRAKTDAPVIFTYHTKFDEDIARAVKSKAIQKGTVRVLVDNIEACDEVWVVSRGAGENLRSLGYQGDYRVVSNGVDFAKGRVDADRVLEVTKDYDLPKDIPLFLFVGRIIEYKGIKIILDACAKLSEQGMDYRCVFVGKGPDEDKFKKYAEKLGLLNNPDSSHIGKVFFTGPIYDRDILRAWNTRADLFLFPSTYDTNGIVVREAAACGTASVLVKDSCAAEGITDDRNGFLIEQNPDSLSALLMRIGTDLDRLYRIGQNAMDEIYISWEDSVHAAYERYGEILDLKAAGRLTVKKKPVEEFFLNMPDEAAEEIRSLNDQGEHWMETMFDNTENMSELIYDSVTGRIKRMMTDLQDQAYDLMSDIEEGMREIRESIDKKQ